MRVGDLVFARRVGLIAGNVVPKDVLIGNNVVKRCMCCCQA